MLKALLSNQLQLGLAQAAVAALAALTVVLLARKRGIHLVSELTIAMMGSSGASLRTRTELTRTSPSDAPVIRACSAPSGLARLMPASCVGSARM